MVQQSSSSLASRLRGYNSSVKSSNRVSSNSPVSSSYSRQSYSSSAAKSILANAGDTLISILDNPYLSLLAILFYAYLYSIRFLINILFNLKCHAKGHDNPNRITMRMGTAIPYTTRHSCGCRRTNL